MPTLLEMMWVTLFCILCISTCCICIYTNKQLDAQLGTVKHGEAGEALYNPLVDLQTLFKSLNTTALEGLLVTEATKPGKSTLEFIVPSEKSPYSPHNSSLPVYTYRHTSQSIIEHQYQRKIFFNATHISLIERKIVNVTNVRLGDCKYYPHTLEILNKSIEAKTTTGNNTHNSRENRGLTICLYVMTIDDKPSYVVKNATGPYLTDLITAWDDFHVSQYTHNLLAVLEYLIVLRVRLYKLAESLIGVLDYMCRRYPESYSIIFKRSVACVPHKMHGVFHLRKIDPIPHSPLPPGATVYNISYFSTLTHQDFIAILADDDSPKYMRQYLTGIFKGSFAASYIEFLEYDNKIKRYVDSSHQYKTVQNTLIAIYFCLVFYFVYKCLKRYKTPSQIPTNNIQLQEMSNLNSN